MLSPLYGQLSPLRVPTKAVRKVSDDADANTYLLAVESADGQELESGVISAVESFITGCKSDGIWTALKASCILAGARTLSGALVPLVGTAPTNANFVSGDYNRETGLLGNGSTKYLNANRNNNADAGSNRHGAVWATQVATNASRNLYGAASSSNNGNLIQFATSTSFRTKASSTISTITVPSATAIGLKGISRTSSANYIFRHGGTDYQLAISSLNPFSSSSAIFAGIDTNAAISGYNASRISFYSIGSGIDLALLDTRVSTLMTDLAAAIP
jgi:hypothetical protein